jgi:hypothetical protein
MESSVKRYIQNIHSGNANFVSLLIIWSAGSQAFIGQAFPVHIKRRMLIPTTGELAILSF